MNEERAKRIREEWLEGLRKKGLLTIELKENQLTVSMLTEMFKCSRKTAIRKANALIEQGELKLVYERAEVFGEQGLCNVYEITGLPNQEPALSEDSSLQSA